MPINIPLKFRIALAIFIIEIIMTSVLLSRSLSLAFEFSREQVRINEGEIMELMVDLSRVPLLTNEYAQLQISIEKLVENQNIEAIRVANIDNIIVVSSSLIDVGRSYDSFIIDDSQGWRELEVQSASGQLGIVAQQFSDATLIEGFQNATRNGVVIALIGISTSVIIGIGSGILLTRDFDKLVQAAQRLGEGDLTVNINVRGKGEIAKVADAFNEMTRKLELNFTRRMQAEEALKQRHVELETILNVAQDILFILNPDGTIIDYRTSMENDLYIPPEVFLDKKMQDVVPSDVGKQFKDVLARIAKTGTKKTIEYQLKVLATDEPQWYEAVLSPHNQNVIVVVHNITRRKMADEQQIEIIVQHERIQVLEEVVSDLSHDMRQPLSSLHTLLYMLGKQEDPGKRQQYLNRMNTQLQRLSKLIEDILILSRLDKGAVTAFTPLNLNLLIENICNNYRESVEERKIDFTFDLSAELPLILGRETELSRALANLIENAINYTPDGNSITVRTYSQGKMIIIEIHDTGIGINEADLSRIFDRFYRSDKARNTRQGGTGLGLAIVKKIVDLHDGIIEAESAPEKGSTFKIKLPIA